MWKVNQSVSGLSVTSWSLVAVRTFTNHNLPQFVQQITQINNRFHLLVGYCKKKRKKVGHERVLWSECVEHQCSLRLVRTERLSWGSGERRKWTARVTRRSRRSSDGQTWRKRKDSGGGGRCLVLLELHIFRRAHLHFSLAYIFPVGAQDRASRLHLRGEDREGEIILVWNDPSFFGIVVLQHIIVALESPGPILNLFPHVHFSTQTLVEQPHSSNFRKKCYRFL